MLSVRNLEYASGFQQTVAASSTNLQNSLRGSSYSHSLDVFSCNYRTEVCILIRFRRIYFPCISVQCYNLMRNDILLQVKLMDAVL
jgi:hypothetical protein